MSAPEKGDVMTDRAVAEALLTRHRAEFATRMGDHLRRIEWSPAQLAAERERRLRILLGFVKDASPWHRARLTGVDPATATEADLLRIQPMTKADLMTNWTSIVTDPRLTREVVDAYVRKLPEDTYLFGRYHVLASGGSSGQRGTFVYDWTEIADIMLSSFRWAARNAAKTGAPRPAPMVAIFAEPGAHVSHIFYHLYPTPGLIRLAATRPMAEIVAALNAAKPQMVAAYPSVWGQLVKEAQAGRLDLLLKTGGSIGEVLLPELREAIKTTFGIDMLDIYGMSEGLYANVCHLSKQGHLAEDLCIVEPVDAEGRPVPPGKRAAKFYLTNLYNLTTPLIRYEVSDEITILDEPCACGSGLRRVAEVRGRSDDYFVYGEVRIHPLALRAPLGKDAAVSEYQVRQTATGVHVLAIAAGPLDVAALVSRLRGALEAAGLQGATATVETVPSLPQTVTGKVKRFVPL